jgi:hypothetical protein
MFNATFSGRAGAPFMMLLALVILSTRLAQELRQPVGLQRQVPAWV